MGDMNLGPATIDGIGQVEITWTNGYVGWYRAGSGAAGEVNVDHDGFSQ